MKRTIPLLITALSGFVLIFAYFIPATESWGESVAIWFDILAAIAYVLGGGNLIKVQLKKISDRKAGWGYAAVTLMAFTVTLIIGLFKVGVTPARNQEYYGESFAPLPVSLLPEFSVPGELPIKQHPQALPPSVRSQMQVADGRLTFRGWMRDDQFDDLISWDSRLEWRANVEALQEAATPPAELRGVLAYHYEHQSLSFLGRMSPEQETALRTAIIEPGAETAVERLRNAASKETSAPVEWTPPTLSIPAGAPVVVENDRLVVQGPLTPSDRKSLERRWAGLPIARQLLDFQIRFWLTKVTSNGPSLRREQVEILNRVLGTAFTAEELRDVLNTAGQAQPTPKSWRELLAEQQEGIADLEPMQPAGESVTVSDAQLAALERFAVDPEFTPDALVEALRAAGPLTPGQESKLRATIDGLPTVGERNYALALELLKAGSLSTAQIDVLLNDYRNERHWRRDVAVLAEASHVVKYPWSGQFDQQGSGFSWLYRYIFQPLTATMFALLAFFVASASFRAFRAKNLAAILLLGTAFIILLGRTFAGVLLTSWLPEELAWLRMENLTIEIMRVFATAGNRAIMIGIALGLASTSLRVLLGVDRSHLGGGDD
ncbi:MAG: hypothetical protein JNG89_05160 [Planctomycetaceae bacterium]|nr:hypothetical protein [Planctomycetaceae bacterium]